MPLSTVLGAQSLIKPGVCTTATRPASPYTGQAIYDTTVSQTLVWSGTAWVVQTGGLVLVKTQTIGSAVSSVAVTDVFSATYENYRILLSGGVSSSTPNIAMTLGSTVTNYAYNNIYMAYSSSALSGEASDSASSWNRVGRGSTNSNDAEIELKSPFDTKRTTAQWRMASSSTNELWSIGGGYLNNATSYTAFTLTPHIGTLTGGTIRVYGYSNS